VAAHAARIDRITTDEATAEVASLAPGLAVPFSNTRSGETLGFKVGTVASRWMVTLCEALPPALVAWQVSVVPVVSVSMTVVSHRTRSCW
jgi:hypothetical protein